MTSIFPPSDDAPFEERVRFYKGLSKISPAAVSGRELRDMANAWLKANGVSPRISACRLTNRSKKGYK